MVLNLQTRTRLLPLKMSAMNTTRRCLFLNQIIYFGFLHFDLGAPNDPGHGVSVPKEGGGEGGEDGSDVEGGRREGGAEQERVGGGERGLGAQESRAGGGEEDLGDGEQHLLGGDTSGRQD